MSVVSTKNDQKITDECEDLMKVKKILIDYYSDYSSNSNASKLDAYLTKVGDNMDNPFFMFKNNLEMSTKVIDAIFMIKQSQLLKLN